jgi:hypothetical protein
LNGSQQQRWATDACRKRAGRAEASRVAAAARTERASGRVRAGLEQWLVGQPDLPEVTVAAARVLADELDADTDASPLWGRYTAILETLTAPEVQAHAVAGELRALIESVALAQADEDWRNEKHVRAIERGDPLAWGWEKVVPISCARGRHSWKSHPDYWGAVHCEHCDTERVEP